MATSPPKLPNPIVKSPVLSITSYSMVSSRSRSPSVASRRPPSSNNSDDEIVWSITESSSTESDGADAATASEHDEYVLLNPPRSPASFVSPTTQGRTRNRGRKANDRAHTLTVKTVSLDAHMENLTLTEGSANNAESVEDGAGTTLRPQEKRRKRKAKKRNRKASAKTPVPLPKPQERSTNTTSAILPSAGLGDRGIVDDLSDTHSVVSFNGGTLTTAPTIYDEAATYISSFLSNPEAKNNAICRLTLLQSLIIELGLPTPSLPDTLHSAKAFLKAHAFLNIREYLSARQEGPEAVQRAMYPSRSALIKDIKRKRDYVSLKWVKKHGLQVLLVEVIYH